jgi:hypothetical protein
MIIVTKPISPASRRLSCPDRTRGCGDSVGDADLSKKVAWGDAAQVAQRLRFLLH